MCNFFSCIVQLIALKAHLIDRGMLAELSTMNSILWMEIKSFFHFTNFISNHRNTFAIFLNAYSYKLYQSPVSVKHTTMCDYSTFDPLCPPVDDPLPCTIVACSSFIWIGIGN